MRFTAERKPTQPGTYYLYDLAKAELNYGKPQMMGDLFGDVMGAVVGKENWDARPQWMKNIKVKPNPTALMRAVPPQYVGRAAQYAQNYGVNTYYRTPAGDVQITPGMMQDAYSNFPMFSRALSGFSNIPVWVYAVGGVGILVLLMSMKRKR